MIVNEEKQLEDARIFFRIFWNIYILDTKNNCQMTYDLIIKGLVSGAI